MNERESSIYTCPLCQKRFEGADCHASCGMSSGCNMVRCPNCSYEFVEQGALANFLRKVFGLKTPEDDAGVS